MLTVILVVLMALCFIGGLLVLFFPFGKESEKLIKVAPATKSLAQISLEEIREAARKATATDDTQVFVTWFEGFYGYNRNIPSSVRYVHMLEWRKIVEELYPEFPPEINVLWATLVHVNASEYSGGWK